MLTRREFGIATLGSLLAHRAVCAADSKIAGVQLGAQTYSFRALRRPADGNMVPILIAALTEIGLNDCELFAPQLEPVSSAGRGAPAEAQNAARESLRKWRLQTPLAHFEAIGKQFKSAGISIFG